MRNDGFPSRETVERLRREYPKGTRVELISMNDPYTKLKPGDTGVIEHIDDVGTVFCRWSNGSGLGVLIGVDEIRIIGKAGDHDD